MNEVIAQLHGNLLSFDKCVFLRIYLEIEKLVLTPQSVGNQLNFLFFSITKKITKRVFQWADRLGGRVISKAVDLPFGVKMLICHTQGRRREQKTVRIWVNWLMQIPKSLRKIEVFTCQCLGDELSFSRCFASKVPNQLIITSIPIILYTVFRVNKLD